MECNYCKNKKFETIFKLRTYTVIKCKNCGLMFNKEFLKDKKFSTELFEKNYYDKIQSEAFENKFENLYKDPRTKIYARYLNKIEKNNGGRTLLDIGSAYGNFLKIAHDRGWKVNGVEISKHASSKVIKKYKFEVFNGEVAKFKTNKKYDLITFWDVIEHVKNPKKNLKIAYDLLNPKGHLLITTDNYNSLIAFLGTIIYTLSFGKINSPVERFYIKYNSFYFTVNSFKKYLKCTGFKEIYFEKIDYPAENLNLNKIEKIIVKNIYFISSLLNWNSQFIIIAKKKN